MLQFTSYHTTTDSNNKTTTIKTLHTADNVSDAHKQARLLFPTADDLRVYVNTTDNNGAVDVRGLCYGAYIVAKRTLKNCIKREGTTQQYNLEKNICAVYIDYNNAPIEKIVDTSKFAIDNQDLIETARTALQANLQDDLQTQYKKAYKAINDYLSETRAIRTDERPAHYSIEQLTDSGRVLINVYKQICIILEPNETYTPNDSDSENELTARKIKAIKELTALLSPVQIKIVKMLACGYSQNTIADKTKRTKSTISQHMQSIRKKAVDLFNANYPDIYATIQNAEYIDGITKKASAHAEKCKEYRKSKKA